jgi:hypothetical protein
MNESIHISEGVKERFTAYASLSGVGRQVVARHIFKPIEHYVEIAQKVVKYTPTAKLKDGLINILAGGTGMVEVNQRVRSDIGLQRAFGRDGCAEQSVIQDTLDACTEENVTQMQHALQVIYQKHSLGYRHDYDLEWQLLDVDMTGRPCGAKAEFATPGYFAHQRNRRGRQVGYVEATWYEETVVARLFAGTTQLNTALPSLLADAERTLQLTGRQRRRTIVRIDSGGGSVDDINWLLARGYQIHGKDYSGQRAQNLAQTVSVWQPDPHNPAREMGWVVTPQTPYCREVTRIAVRCRKKNGQWGIGVLLSTLTPHEVLWLTGLYDQDTQDPTLVLYAYVYFYDLRGGGVETEIKEDKQGLGTTKRHKKRFPAQQVLLQLEVLAHNVTVWARAWLAPRWPQVHQFGIPRLVRDVFRVHGKLILDRFGQVVHIVLNQDDALAGKLAPALADLLRHQHIAVTLGEI